MNKSSAAAAWAALTMVLSLACATSAAAAQAFERGPLRRLDKPGVAPSWVYGTLHSSDPRVTLRPAEVGGALAAARSFAMEIYLTDVTGAALVEASQFDDGRRGWPPF